MTTSPAGCRFLEYWLDDMIQLPRCWTAATSVALLLLPLLISAACRYFILLSANPLVSTTATAPLCIADILRCLAAFRYRHHMLST